MRRITFLVLLLFLAGPLSGQNANDDERLKVGVVLSGGGAKGMAHIGVLKVIEEAGVTVDYIAGTSMGAIVASLYASGYSAKELDSIFRNIDFGSLIQDNIPRSAKTFYEKEDSEIFIKRLEKRGLKCKFYPSYKEIQDKVDFAKFGPIDIKPLSRIQQITGANLHRNWVMIPHVTQFDAADITDLEALRKESNKSADKDNVKLTLLAFLMKALIASLKEFPTFNASFDNNGNEINLVMKNYFHLGFAVDTSQGLVVPVIKDVDQKGVIVIAKELSRLSILAREGKLKPTDMQGASFTVSSLGGIGGTAFTPIINAPEVAILGLSRASIQPVYRDDQFVPRLMLPLSLSYDHRVIDGASAARFTTHLATVLTDMRLALL